ncbi:MAG TPA: hypothetical protein VK638_51025 [Edaphobacter sp.]|nr:hypothetical protein [Edaphobacter sp.]
MGLGTLLAETRLPGDAEAFAGRDGDPFQSLAGQAGRGEWRARSIDVDLTTFLQPAKLKRTSELQPNDESAIPSHESFLLSALQLLLM